MLSRCYSRIELRVFFQVVVVLYVILYVFLQISSWIEWKTKSIIFQYGALWNVSWHEKNLEAILLYKQFDHKECFRQFTLKKWIKQYYESGHVSLILSILFTICVRLQLKGFGSCFFPIFFQWIMKGYVAYAFI